jgi:O-antigen biosynthesis protein
VKILIVHESIPRPDRSGCDLRLLRILAGLHDAGHQIALIARAPSSRDREYIHGLTSFCEQIYVSASKNRHDALELWFKGAPCRLREILSDGFDVALLPLWFWKHVSIPEDFIDQIRLFSPSTVIAVLVDDCQGLRQAELARLTDTFIDYELAEDYTQREGSVYRSADAIIAISAAERAYALKFAPGLRSCVLPFSVPQQPLPQASFEERTGLLFLADFNNYAARDALRWFVNEPWPIISRGNKEVCLTVAGHRSLRVASWLGPRMACLGHVRDLWPIFDSHRLFISPLRVGTGIATKNVLAMSYGLPIITTSIGVQSLGNVERFVVVAPTTAEAYAHAVLDHYDNKLWWTRSSISALEWARTRFGSESDWKAINECVDLFSELSRVKQENAHRLMLNQTYFPFDMRDETGEAQIKFAETLLERGDTIGAIVLLRYALHCLRSKENNNASYCDALALLGHCKALAGDAGGAARARAELLRIRPSTCSERSPL